jgi:hypothetical protein
LSIRWHWTNRRNRREQRCVERAGIRDQGPWTSNSEHCPAGQQRAGARAVDVEPEGRVDAAAARRVRDREPRGSRTALRPIASASMWFASHLVRLGPMTVALVVPSVWDVLASDSGISATRLLRVLGA